MKQNIERSWRLMNWNTGEGLFSVDLYETEDEVVVRAAVAGIASKVRIRASSETLGIQGEMSSSQEERGAGYYRQERRSGSFSRTLPLPSRVDAERATASFTRGTLVIRLPKLASGESKSVDVDIQDDT